MIVGSLKSQFRDDNGIGRVKKVEYDDTTRLFTSFSNTILTLLSIFLSGSTRGYITPTVHFNDLTHTGNFHPPPRKQRALNLEVRDHQITLKPLLSTSVLDKMSAQINSHYPFPWGRFSQIKNKKVKLTFAHASRGVFFLFTLVRAFTAFNISHPHQHGLRFGAIVRLIALKIEIITFNLNL